MKFKNIAKKSLSFVLIGSVLLSNSIISLAQNVTAPGSYGAVYRDAGYNTNLGSLTKPTFTIVDKSGNSLSSSKYYKSGSKYYVSGEGYVKIAFPSSFDVGCGWFAGKTVTITDSNGIHGHIAGSFINNGIQGYWMWGEITSGNQIADVKSKKKQTEKSAIYSVSNFNKIKVIGRASSNTDPEATISAVYDMSGSSSKIEVTSDTTAPTISSSVTGTSAYGCGNVLWYLDSANVTFTGSDEKGGSGLKAIMVNNGSYPSGVNFTPTNTTTYYAYSVDNVGNTSNPENFTVYVDRDAPVIAAYTRNASKSTGTVGVYDFTFTDGSSGLDSYAVSTSATTPAASSFISVSQKNALSGVTSISFNQNGNYYIFLKDRVGHITSKQIYAVADGTGPAVSSKVYDTSLNVLTPVNSWYTTIPSILRVFANDDGGIKYLDINGVRNTPASATNSYYVDTNITKDGVYSYQYSTSDNIGNISDGNITVKFDTQNPYDLKFSKITTAPVKDFVSLNISAKDDSSGIANIKLYIDTNNNIADIDENTDLTKLTYNWVEATNVYNSGKSKTNPIVVSAGDQGPTSTNYNLFLTENGIYRYSVTDIAGHTTYSTDGDISSGIILIDEFDSTAPTAKTEVIGNEIFTGISVPYTNTLNSIAYYNANTYLRVKGTDSPNNPAEKNLYSGIKSLNVSYNAFVPATYDADGNVLTQPSVEYITDSMTFPAKTLNAEHDFFISDAYDQTFTYFVDDHAGNKSMEEVETVYLDKDAPENANIEAKSDLTKTVTSQTGVELSTSASDKLSGLRYIILMYAGEDGNFTEYARKEISNISTTLLNGTNDFKVTKNGYYKVRAVDNVGNVYDKDDKIITVKNIDDGAPTDVNIKPDTTEWVNEDTGVLLTSSAKDEGSGIASITTWGLGDTDYVALKTTNFTLIKESNSDNYRTHENNSFIASATDVTGNNTTMDKKEALEVTNIDPVAPTVDVKVTNGVFGVDGCPIKVTAVDKESGLKSLKIQRYEGNDEWVDVTEDSKGVSNVFAVNKLSFSNDKANATQTTTFYVKENGTYRILADDVVLNETASTALTVSGVDSAGPVITVSGNPTDWTNEDATIIIKAVDKDGSVADISIDGKSQSIVSGSVATCNFVVSKNGTHEIVATDNAGNTSSYTLNVTKIDKKAPTVSYKIKNYNKEAQTCDIEMTLKDDLSGVAKAYLNNFKLTVDGSTSVKVTKNVVANNTYTCAVTDAAGNKTSVDIKASRKLVSIEVTNPPKKTEYKPGENFDKTDMVVTATYDDGSKEVITDYTITNGEDLKDGQDSIKIEYTEGDVTVYTTTPIKVGEDNGSSDNNGETSSKSNNSKSQKTTKGIQNIVTNDSSPLFILVAIITIDLIILVIALAYKKRKLSH